MWLLPRTCIAGQIGNQHHHQTEPLHSASRWRPGLHPLVDSDLAITAQHLELEAGAHDRSAPIIPSSDPFSFAVAAVPKGQTLPPTSSPNLSR